MAAENELTEMKLDIAILNTEFKYRTTKPETN